jgi:SAM-dependent methyltransferase
MSSKGIWQSPIYEFRVPAGADDSGNDLIKEVVVDVTTSAPRFEDPGKTLGRILGEALDYLRLEKRERIDRILDFGAGKLRNTIFLLQKKHNVTAVEFGNLSTDSPQGQRLLAKAKRFRKRFKELVFPHQFTRSGAKFDLALLVNVLNIMPVPSERLLVLQHCHEKLRKGGHLFWYTQYGDYDQNKRCTAANVLGDGYYIGKTTKFKSFYREFSAHEIDEMLISSGFALVKTFDVSHNQARLYRKEQVAGLTQVLGPTLVRKELNIKTGVPKPEQVTPRIQIRKSRERLQEPESAGLAVETLYVAKLKKIKPGRDEAIEYQKLVLLILARVFDSQFRKIRFEESLYEKRKRVDLIAINSAERGFFEELSSKHQVKCGYIPIECKNYKITLGNPEFDQIGGRLNEKFGLFGLLIYRSGDSAVALKHCQDRLDDRKHIIALDDEDLVKLLTLRQSGDGDGIEDLLNIKFIALIGKK